MPSMPLNLRFAPAFAAAAAISALALAPAAHADVTCTKVAARCSGPLSWAPLRYVCSVEEPHRGRTVPS